MKHNLKYIVVHSTRTMPGEPHTEGAFHYIIDRSGKTLKEKKLLEKDACLQVAYVGGLNNEGKLADTRNPVQTDKLFNQLVSLSEKYPQAKIIGAGELFSKEEYPGFDVKTWLKNYVPDILDAA